MATSLIRQMALKGQRKGSCGWWVGGGLGPADCEGVGAGDGYGKTDRLEGKASKKDEVKTLLDLTRICRQTLSTAFLFAMNLLAPIPDRKPKYNIN